MAKIDLYPTAVSSPSTAKVATGTELTGDKVALDVNVLAGSMTGTFTPSGLKDGLKITTMDVGDTPIALPPTPFTNRNAISVVNLEPGHILYIGGATVTADRVIGTTSGWEVNNAEAFNLDITDSVAIYGVAPAGKTIRVKILELA